MSGKGKLNSGTFWAQHVKGDEIFVQVKCQGMAVKERGNFVIDEVAVGFVADHEDVDNNSHSRRTAVCGLDDKENAICYYPSQQYEEA